MSFEIDEIITRYAGFKGILSREKLLQEIYCSMHSDNGKMMSAEEKKIKLAIYLGYKHKSCDGQDSTKPVLRALLQEILKITNADIEREVKLLKDIPDAYFPNNEGKFITKLDELIAHKIVDVIGRIGIIKMAILEFEEKINRKNSPLFLKNNGQNQFYRVLHLEIKQLGKLLDSNYLMNSNEKNHSRKIDEELQRILNTRIDIPELLPLRNAVKIFRNLGVIQKHQYELNRLQELAKMTSLDLEHYYQKARKSKKCRKTIQLCEEPQDNEINVVFTSRAAPAA